ncbi:MAG: HPr family phosphocarrier protein [Desulfobacterales bacterium]|nr:HPr family phosphocarrier protein [Desulfobacterales bacterium]
MHRTSRKRSVDVTIVNELGLHARAAARIAMLADKAESKIWMIKDGEKADASSIIDILALACHKGSKITLTADCQTDTDTLTDIVNLIRKGLSD